MQVLEIIVLIVAYTLSSIALFLELICYSRKIETKETIFFTIALILLLVAISIANFGTPANQITIGSTHVFVLLAMILVGSTTLMSAFVDRQVVIKPLWIKIFHGFSGVLFVMTFLGCFLEWLYIVEGFVYAYLFLTVMGAMLLIRNTKPMAIAAHRENSERLGAIICLIILPITLFLDFFLEKIPVLKAFEMRMGFTLPLFFIFLASYKLKDDSNRLSLFQPENVIKEQNLKNYSFTKRELEVVNLIIKGATYNQIAEQLFISLPTVKTHVTNIYKKAQVHNKIELVRLLLN